MNDHVFAKGIIRTPLLPYRLLEDLVSGQMQWEQVLEDPLFLNGLYLASPELYNSCQQWKAGNLEDNRKKSKFKNSVLKYVYRAAARCTPFGLFAGLGAVDVQAPATELRVGPAAGHRTHVRMDMDFLGSLAKEISNCPFVKPYLKYQVNSTLYRLGENYRFVEHQYVGTIRKFSLTSLEYTPAIEAVLRAAAGGSFIGRLAGSIVDEDVSQEDAEAFVGDLIDVQVLTGELQPSTTGEESGKQLLSTLHEVLARIDDAADRAALGNLIGQIETMTDALAGLSRVDSHEAGAYVRLTEAARQFGIGFSEKFLIQCDTLLRFERPATVSAQVVETVREGLAVLDKLSRRGGANPKMEKFIKSFVERYEEREVPLVEALDVEIGIGYGNQQENLLDFAGYVDNLVFEVKPEAGREVRWNQDVHAFLAAKMVDACRTQEQVIHITEEEARRLPRRTEDSRRYHTYTCLFSLFHDAAGHQTIAIQGAGGHTAAAWLGRFCHAEPAIHQMALDVTAVEERLNPAKIVAEVNHLPQDRLGNVLQRPILRNYEIPFQAGSFADPDRQLDINDLLLSVRNGRIVLRSARHGKEVLPYISNALFHEKDSLPVFHFLGDLQLESNRKGFVLDLGALADVFKFIPRIQYRNVILRRASWTLDEADVRTISAFGEDNLFERFTAWADALGLPACFVLQDYDNELPIDRRSPDAVKVFAEEIKGEKQAVLLEFLMAGHASPVVDGEGNSYNNEILLFFHNGTEASQPAAPVPAAPAVPLPVTRDFIPGSEWVYFKIYTGFKYADKLLSLLNPELDRLVAEGVIAKWFFIRYADPRQHLRLRLRVAGGGNVQQALTSVAAILNGLLQEGLLSRVMLDTYRRELERYGRATIEEVESIFYLDSLLCCQLIAQLPDDARWLAALYSAHSYLEAFGLDLRQRLQLTEALKSRFEAEFGAVRETRKALNANYNLHRNAIRRLMGETVPAVTADEAELLEGITRLVDDRYHPLRALAARIIEKTAGTDERTGILTSLIHMHFNRLFRAKQRIFEYSIYDFLKSYYTSAQFVRVPQPAGAVPA